MTLAFADRTFGNRGTLWTAVPDVFQDQFTGEKETHLVGGTTVGLQILNDGSVCLIVWGWEFGRPWQPGNTAVRMVRFPVDGGPRELDRGDGTAIGLISEEGRMSDPLATCATANNDLAVLIRQAPEGNGPGAWSYAICTVASSTQLGTITRRHVDPSWLYDTLGTQPAGSTRMAADGAGFALASSRGTRVRFAMIGAAGAAPRDIDLASAPALPGLVRLEVASLRLSAGRAIIALTAHLNHTLPAIGATSVGALLQLLTDGTPDVTFGDNGLWVSPLVSGQRGFSCAGEADGFVAGCVDRRALVFAVAPNGIELDDEFGGGGVAEHDLGGRIASPVAAFDGSHAYLFAQHVPAVGSTASDYLTVGCRFRTVPGASNYGHVDTGWGPAGTVTIHSDGASLTPAAMAIRNARVFLGGTRQLFGTNCDRIPSVTVLAQSNADPDPNFGAGGFSLHASIRHPAHVAPDGSATFVERSAAATGPALRFVSAHGEIGNRVPLALLPPDSAITSIRRLSDGSLVIAGGGPEPWVIKTDAAGAPDPSFGTAGRSILKPGAGAGSAAVLGVRADGRIALRVDTLGKSELTVLLPNGQVDAVFGTSGFVDVPGFTHLGAGPGGAHCFLASDDSFIVVLSTEHAPASYSSPFVSVALRRVTTGGQYDPNFGLGAPSVSPPPAARLLRLLQPDGATSGNAEYNRINPAGIGWAGGQLYVFATGFSGGRYTVVAGVDVRLPVYPLLLVMRWNGDGSLDRTFAGRGWQEAGYHPDRKYWSIQGVIQEGPASFVLYGMAGEAETITTSVAGGPAVTSTIIRQPQPALFHVQHPAGLDLGFGGDGAARQRLQEVMLTPVAGALLSARRVRLACVDFLSQPEIPEPRTNQGGLIQWQLREPKKPRPIPRPRIRKATSPRPPKKGRPRARRSST
jgi:hypothetical protein